MTVGPVTSAEQPIPVWWVDEDVPPAGGRIGVTYAPGKSGPAVYSARAWARDLEADIDRLVTVHRVDVLVSLVDDHELQMLHIVDLVDVATTAGLDVIRFPVRDGAAPALQAATETIERVLVQARGGRRVVFHCRGGRGRAGLFAACALVSGGLPADRAITRTRQIRDHAIETAEQEAFVATFEAQHLITRLARADVDAATRIRDLEIRAATPELERLIRGAKGVFRVRVAEALYRFSQDPGLAWPIVESLERDDTAARIEAAIALRAFPGPIARDGLLAAANDPDDAVRYQVAESLKILK